jgi:ABC-2 type transport system ATP-binding protein
MLLGGLALGALVYDRVEYGWVAIAMLVAAGGWSLTGRRRPAARRFVGVCAIAVASCIPWLIYTYSITGRLLYWGNSGGLSLYWMSTAGPDQMGAWHAVHTVFRDAYLAPFRPFFSRIDRLHPLARDLALQRAALRNIGRHPLNYVGNLLANISRMLFAAPLGVGLPAPLVAGCGVLTIAVLSFAGTGAARLRRLGGPLPREAAPFALFLVLGFGIHVFPTADPRMLMPLIPLLVWAGAQGWGHRRGALLRTASTVPAEPDLPTLTPRVGISSWTHRRQLTSPTMVDRQGTPSDELPIQATGLRKVYRDRPAVDGIDLTVGRGEIYGFLGPNGAGKTTTMRMLLGLVRPDAGTIRLFGRDPLRDELAARSATAGIIEEPRLYTYLSGRRNLTLLASYDRSGAGRDVIDDALRRVELLERADDRVSEYSQGMRQRLGIAACLVRRPRLLMLDEPANGLDPAGIRFLRGLLRELAADGITVFLSSHLLAEVQELCSRAAIIAAGRIAYEGPLEELRARAGRRYRLRVPDRGEGVRICAELGGISKIEVDGDEVTFAIDDDATLLGLTRRLTGEGIVMQALVPEQLTLERVFFELTEPAGSSRRVVA